eukprot:scaffold301_cov370-Pavlova_lutheri.AAC.21
MQMIPDFRNAGGKPLHDASPRERRPRAALPLHRILPVTFWKRGAVLEIAIGNVGQGWLHRDRPALLPSFVPPISPFERGQKKLSSQHRRFSWEWEGRGGVQERPVTTPCHRDLRPRNRACHGLESSGTVRHQRSVSDLRSGGRSIPSSETSPTCCSRAHVVVPWSPIQGLDRVPYARGQVLDPLICVLEGGLGYTPVCSSTHAARVRARISPSFDQDVFPSARLDVSWTGSS